MSKEMELMKSLFHINRMLYREIGKGFKAEGLNSTEVMILYRIKHGCENVRPSELAKNMGIPASTFTGMIDRLVEKGYILRERSDEDRRSIGLKINGVKMHGKEAGENVTAAHLKDVLSCIDDKEQEELLSSIKKLEEALLMKAKGEQTEGKDGK